MGFFKFIIGILVSFLSIVALIWFKMLYGSPNHLIIVGIGLAFIVFIWIRIEATIKEKRSINLKSEGNSIVTLKKVTYFATVFRHSFLLLFSSTKLLFIANQLRHCFTTQIAFCQLKV